MLRLHLDMDLSIEHFQSENQTSLIIHSLRIQLPECLESTMKVESTHPTHKKDGVAKEKEKE